MPFGALGQHQLGAVGDQELAALEAHRLGHGQGERNSARGGDKGQRDAGIAAGRLDDLLAGPEQAALFGVPDHRRADPALHRISGIATLDLGENRRPCAVGHPVEANERRPPDRMRIVLEPICHDVLLIQTILLVDNRRSFVACRFGYR